MCLKSFDLKVLLEINILFCSSQFRTKTLRVAAKMLVINSYNEVREVTGLITLRALLPLVNFPL